MGLGQAGLGALDADRVLRGATEGAHVGAFAVGASLEDGLGRAGDLHGVTVAQD